MKFTHIVLIVCMMLISACSYSTDDQNAAAVDPVISTPTQSEIAALRTIDGKQVNLSTQQPSISRVQSQSQLASLSQARPIRGNFSDATLQSRVNVGTGFASSVVYKGYTFTLRYSYQYQSNYDLYYLDEENTTSDFIRSLSVFKDSVADGQFMYEDTFVDTGDYYDYYSALYGLNRDPLGEAYGYSASFSGDGFLSYLDEDGHAYADLEFDQIQGSFSLANEVIASTPNTTSSGDVLYASTSRITYSNSTVYPFGLGIEHNGETVNFTGTFSWGSQYGYLDYYVVENDQVVFDDWEFFENYSDESGLTAQLYSQDGSRILGVIQILYNEIQVQLYDENGNLVDVDLI